MTLKITFLWERLVTLATLVWFFTSVCPYMSIKNTFPIERLVTLNTLLWFFTSMYPQMWSKMIFQCKRQATFTTLVWLLTRIYPLMAIKFTSLCESLVTFSTLIWFFTVCVLKCSVNAPFSVKDLPHWLHWYECVLNPSPHISFRMLSKKIGKIVFNYRIIPITEDCVFIDSWSMW